ncbi:MAG: hypothetical protein AB1Z23_03125 [Eubacteriales bacterium]
MKRFFSRELFKDSIKEILNISIVLLVLGVITTILAYWFGRGEMPTYYTSAEVFNVVDIALFGVMILGSNMIARKLVSFAWSKAKTDSVYSSPYTREQIFCTKALAAVTVQWVLLAVISLAGALLTMKHMGKIVFAGDIIVTTLNMMLGSLLIIGAVFLSIGVTGRKGSSALIADWIVLMPALMFIVRYFTGTYRRIRFNSYFMQKFDLYIIPNLLLKTLGRYDATRYLPSIIAGIVLAAGLFIAGALLFKRRSGELTGNYTKNKLSHFLLIGFLPFVIVFITFLYLFTSGGLTQDTARLAIFFFGLAAVLVFVQERVINQKICKNNRCIWVFLACVVLAFAIVYPAFLIANRDDSRQLTSDEIESVNFVNYGQYGSWYRVWDDPTYGEYISTEYNIKSTRVINKIVDLYSIKNEKFTDNSGIERILIKINLKSGESIMARVPAFYDRLNHCGSIRMDTDDALYSQEEYMNMLYAPMPTEYITFIYDSYMYKIEDRQDTLIDILNELTDEFDELSYNTKREIAEVNMGGWTLNYVNIYANYDEECIIPIGYIYVKGRAGSDMMVDKYKLTAYTPNASNAYIKMVYEQNAQAYKEFAEKYNSDPAIYNCPIDVHVYYMDEQNQLKIIGKMPHSSIEGWGSFRQEIGDAIKDYDMEMPQIGDTFAVVEYMDEEARDTVAMFIKISDGEKDELLEIFDEYSQK